MRKEPRPIGRAPYSQHQSGVPFGAYIATLASVSVVIQVGPDNVGLARINRYLRDCGGDVALAQELFEWNIAMSGALYESLHLFEVILRNAIDREFRNWNAANGRSRDWLIDPHPYLLKVLHTSSLQKAQTRASQAARKAGRPRVHDDVLAQMTLGTWRYVLPSRSNPTKQRLWTDATSKAFPIWRGPWENLVTRVEVVHEIRNRVAHLEPVHASDLRSARRAMRDVCNATSWSNGRLFVQMERMLPLIESAPV